MEFAKLNSNQPNLLDSVENPLTLWTQGLISMSQDEFSPLNTSVIITGPKPSAPTIKDPPPLTAAQDTSLKSLMPTLRLGPRVFKPQNSGQLLQNYETKIKERVMLRERSFPFINPLFHPEFSLCQGLTLVGALTGQAKSTTNANVLAGFLESCPDKKALVISNEETLDTVYNRVACVRLKLDFNRYHKGFLAPKLAEKVEFEARTLMERIIVVVEEDGWDMSYFEDVRGVLEHVAQSPGDIALVTIDYLQTVASSRENRLLTQYDISKRLGLYLKNYGRRLGAPVVLFAQLKSVGVNAQDFKNRVEGDSTVLNHAADAIEIVPNFQDSTTKFVIRKSRFGIPQGTEVQANFAAGRYEFGGPKYEF